MFITEFIHFIHSDGLLSYKELILGHRLMIFTCTFKAHSKHIQSFKSISTLKDIDYSNKTKNFKCFLL